MKPTSVIEISRNALQGNIALIREIVGPDCVFSSVVKGNAYGHGISSFVPVAEACGIDHFSVFSAEEASRVSSVTRKDTTIVVMGMIDPGDLEWLVHNGIEFFVFDLQRLEDARDVGRKLGKPAKVHLELETGLNRTGIAKDEYPHVAEFVTRNREHIHLRAICTHFAGAESIANYHRILGQIRRFRSGCSWFAKNGLNPPLNHTACSAATIMYPNARMDLVRIGILQYGFWPSRETLMNYLGQRENKLDPLKQVITWKTRVMSIKQVKAGEFIGYGTIYLAENDMEVAVIPVGYSEGYNRNLSNQGRVLIQGTRASVVGTVNMNMLMADITNVPGVRVGDEVVLIGAQAGMSVSVSSFTELSDQLNYELLTRLPADIPRVVTD